MSIKAMNWAWSLKLSPSPKLILMALADAADDTGECWPRLKTIAGKCCMSERTVQRALKEFEATSLLGVTRRFTSEGRQTSNGYRLALNFDPDKLSPCTPSCQGEGDKDAAGRATPLRRTRLATALSPLEPPLNTPKESTQQPLDPAAPQKLHFPIGLMSSDRAEVENLLITIDQVNAQALLDELAGALDPPNSIKTTPSRWLRALIVRMRQGRFVPTAGLRIAERRAEQQGRDALHREQVRREAQRELPTAAESVDIREKLLTLRAHLANRNTQTADHSRAAREDQHAKKSPKGSTPPQQRKLP